MKERPEDLIGKQRLGMQALFTVLINMTPLTCLLAIVERCAAITIHICYRKIVITLSCITAIP